MKRRAIRILLFLVLVAACRPASAYVGPGAGFAVLGSFLTIIGAVLLSLASILLWPVLWLVRLPRRLAASRRWRRRRVLILGLDGVSPDLLERMMDDGSLPAFSLLRAEGSYHRLETTTPPISPVAWSTFQTGVNPGKHGVFDFVSRLPGSYAARMSFSEITETRGRWGRSRTHARLLRRSVPFWRHLAAAGVPSAAIRVPVSFPCEPGAGSALAAMGVPDLRGTQGSCTVVTDSVVAEGQRGDSVRVPARRLPGGGFEFALPGPAGSAGAPLSVRMTLRPAPRRAAAWDLRFGRTVVGLVPGSFSEWVPVDFRDGRRRIRGQVQFLLRCTEPALHLYVSPVNIDAQAPALPLSQPPAWAYYLSKKLGRFSTLGICEDMSAVKDGALTADEFLGQAHLVHRERRAQWFNQLRVQRAGHITVVFDLPDRLQHIFWRDGDPAPELAAAYRELDALLGETRRRMCPGDLLMVLSDHGFCSFRRSVNLNAWLRDEGYLVLRDGAALPAGVADIDWSRTRAYCLGLCGMYLNTEGREPQGIVPAGEAPALALEIREKLLALRDGAEPVLRDAHPGAAVYSGPYAADAPDIVVGFHRGYRMSSASAVTETVYPVIDDNREPWAADHSVDFREVPGIFLCSEKVAAPPHIRDIAPTTLEAFGLPVPDYMDGRSLLPA